MIPHAPKVIVIDFDGTLCEFDFPRIGPAIDGAKEALQKFRELGYYIIIYSCRTSKWLSEQYEECDTIPVMERQRVKDMVDWLILNEIPFDCIDDGSKGKPAAEIYLDDKAYRVDHNWNYISKLIEYITVEDSQIDF